MLNARATGDPQLRLLAGVDFTLRDGRVEETACKCQAKISARSIDECPVQANLGNKLDYMLGRATGSPDSDNVRRSIALLRQLERIGLSDTPETRSYLASELQSAYSNQDNVVTIQPDCRVVRESLLTGPRGFLKMRTVWEDNKLITVFLFSGE